jgi:voltage-gated potassium channel
MQRWLYQQLVPEARASGISLMNLVIVGLVLLSFLFLALETEPTLNQQPAWAQLFAVFNITVVVIFAVEYVARIWVAGIDPQYRGVGGRLKYVTRFYSVADLMAFLPELVVILMGGGGSLLVLRVLRLARLIKIARFIPAFDALGAALRRSSSQLLTSLAVALALVYVAAVLLYFVEGVGGEQQETFASIPRAIWWAVATLTTVGYGDVYPVTPLGRFFAAIIAIAGIGVVALPAGVFASAFSDELRERRERGTRL